ncbi:hypothetical protein PGTUg99_027773 [Puccinia graminis f. sp. tritici]|uniref:Uncharacterized protein n=1 Tax=Puccinia graminis f. sp. tritici TaxID=56615 RepID=A0A5B0N5X1_PUCGR|nr:hypothetical protein PGTUg99_027773 [Puccinia graminis f. sp. tritici]
MEEETPPSNWNLDRQKRQSNRWKKKHHSVLNKGLKETERHEEHPTALQRMLRRYGMIPINQGELRTKLFQRYVRLARSQSPESVKRWIGHDSLDGPLPAPDALVVSQIRIYLALYEIDFPAQAKRGHMVQLYQSITPAAPAQRTRIPASPATSATVSVVSVVIPPHPEHKKRKANLRAKSPPPKPLPKSNAPQAGTLLTQVSTHVGKPGVKSLPSHGKSKRVKSSARKDTFFSPYGRPEPEQGTQPSRARLGKTGTSSRPSSSRARSLSQMSDSSDRYAFRRSPRLRSAQLSADSEDRSSQISTSQRAENDVQDEESENDVQDEESQNPSDDDSGTPSTVCPVDSPINAVSSREASEDTHASEQPTEEGPDSPLEPSPNRRTFDSFSISPGRSSVPASANGSQASDSSQKTTQEEDSEPLAPSNSNAGAHSPMGNASPRGSEGVTVSSSPSSQRSSVPAGDFEENHTSRSSQSSSRPADQESDQDYDQESDTIQRSLVPAGDFEEYPDTRSSQGSSRPADEESPASQRSPVTAGGLEENHDSRSSQEFSRPADMGSKASQRSSVRARDFESSSERTKKRKSENPSEWPDASALSRTQLERYLDAHDVQYNSSTRLARMVGSYNLLRSNLGELHPPKRSRAIQSSPPSSSAGSKRRRNRRNRSRVVASSDDEDVGFVYSRPDLPRTVPIPPCSPSHSGSSAGRSNYQPSVAPTETSVATASQTSISTRSTTRAARDFPTKNARQKRAKKIDHRLRTSERAGKRRKQESRPKRTRRRIRTHHEEDETINFVPVLPSTSKKRKNLSSSSARVKKNRSDPDDLPAEFPTHGRPSTSRRRPTKQAGQNSYTPQPSFCDDGEVDVDDEPPRPIDQSQYLEPLSRPSQSNAKGKERAREDTYAPSSPHPDSRSKGKGRAREDSYASSSSLHPQHDHPHRPHPSHRKRPGPDDRSPSPQRAKRQATPAAHRIPTAAQVQRRRERGQRVRRNSLTITSIHDDIQVPVPNHSDVVERWRTSVPPGLPSPLPSPHHPTHAHSGRCHAGGSSCVGQKILSDFVTATGRLTDCIGNLAATNAASLQQTTSQAQRGSSGTYDHRSLLARVRLHIRTLFGRTMHLNVFPPQATELEKASWKRDPENDYSEDDTASEASSDCNADEPDSDEPFFPYRDGPGHPDASMSILKIMRRSMRRSGVVSFRPDFTRGVRDTDNKFLWDLAHSIFVKLVRADEYPEIDLQTCTTTRIRRAILNHAKQLKRTYREAGWPDRRQDLQAQKKRRQMRTTRLRDARLKFCTTDPSLIPFMSVITHCTSDAESEDSDEDSEEEGSDMDTSDHRRLATVVKLPWRHPRIEEAVIAIDQLIERQRKGGNTKFGRSSPFTRVRPRNPKISTRPCPRQLPAQAYCEDWLSSLRIPEVNELNVQPGPSLKGIVKSLKNRI